jgi:hypothetical protein
MPSSAPAEGMRCAPSVAQQSTMQPGLNAMAARTTRGGAHFLELAAARGLRVGGHTAHRLPWLVRGMDVKEHLHQPADGIWSPVADDVIQLSRHTGAAVVPTLHVVDIFRRLLDDSTAGADTDGAAFLAASDWVRLRNMRRALQDTAAPSRMLRGQAATVRRLQAAGVTVGAGTDGFLPWAMHDELEALVRAGLSPLEAIAAATTRAARILGTESELGRIAVGYRADIVLLDANPMHDIRHTRRIVHVIRDGALVDRAGIAARGEGASR